MSKPSCAAASQSVAVRRLIGVSVSSRLSQTPMPTTMAHGR
jgi:hypothetical protein